MNFVYIADSVNGSGRLSTVGGAEQNDSALLSLLEERGHSVTLIRSDFPEGIKTYLSKNDDTKVIVSNFVFMFKSTMAYIRDNHDYIIYEHDHKYLMTRDPSFYEDYTAPDSEKQNIDFYKSAKAVFCQSLLHKSIVERNIEGVNAISVSGNLWEEEMLDMLEELCENEKDDKFFIMKSAIEHKNTMGCIKYCEATDTPYVVVGDLPHAEFLREMSKHGTIFFMPRTVETLSRIVVEARMLGCNAVINKKIGAASEDWFSLKGKPLIDIMRNKRERIPQLIEKVFE